MLKDMSETEKFISGASVLTLLPQIINTSESVSSDDIISTISTPPIERNSPQPENMDREKSPSAASSSSLLISPSQTSLAAASAPTSSMSSSSSSSVVSLNNVRKTSATAKPDETIYKMAPEAVDPAILSRGSLTCRRYTKSALMLLRDEELSRICPPCAKDRKLFTLGVWKVDQPNYLNHNGVGGGGNNGGSGGGGGGGANGGRAISGSGGLSGNTNNQKNLMDHRNVSSSLMPAFMKRRIIGNANSGGGHNNSGADPKERIRKDLDPSVSLSPQRKSINMGCQMPTVSHAVTERDAPAGSSGGGGGRERRIGSGRLPPRDVNWDYRPDKESGSCDGPEYTNYRSNMNSYRDHRGMSGGANANNSERSGEYRERYERRPYGRNDYDRGDNRDNSNYVRRFISDLASQHMNSHTGAGNSMGGGGNDRRRQYSDTRTEEPEWFSGGPTSQHDTIELRGFDDTDEIGSYSSGGGRNLSSSQKSVREQQLIGSSAASEGSHQSSNSSGSKDVQDDVETIVPSCTSPPPARSTPTKTANDSNNNTSEDKLRTMDENKLAADQKREKHVEFNFEAFLNVDPLNNILVGDQKARDTGSSRFSQWFKRSGGDPYQNQKSVNDSRRSSLHEELTNMLNEAGCSPSSRINGPAIDTEKYFAPISPAAASSQTNTLLEFLQKGKFNTMPSNTVHGGVPPGVTNMSAYPLDKQKPGVIPSVEELEARMRKNETSGGGGALGNNLHPFGQIIANNMHQQQIGAPNSGPPQPQDMEAFKKLLEQIAPGVKANVGINAMSAALQAQQQQQIVLQQMINRAKQEELKKIFQQQQMQHQLQQQQQRNNNIQQIRLNELLFKIANGKMGGRNEVFKRPEAQAIVQGLIRGEINQAALHQQLGTPTISARYRETIVTVLNYLNPNSRVSSPSFGAQQILSPIPQPTQQHSPNGQQQQIPGGQQQPGQQPPTNSTATGLPQRIPSPRELQYHTQTIMQSALIKKKLEEQQENFRRRQEIQKQQHQQGGGPSQAIPGSINDDCVGMPPTNFSHGSPPPPNKQHSQSQQINSPTPLAFTPTSVLRKMTAEKDSFLAASSAAVAAIENAKSLQVVNKAAAMHSLLLPNLAAQQQQQQTPAPSQPRMILGGGSSVQSQSQQNQPPPQIGGLNQPISPGGSIQQAMRNNSMKWNQMNLNQLHINKPMGRPILKGGPTPSAGATPAMTPQMPYASKVEYQQKQQQHQAPQPARNNPQQANLLLSQIQQQQQQQHLQQLFQQRQRAAMRAQYQQMQYQQHMLQQAPGTGINSSGSQSGNESATQAPGSAAGSPMVTGTGLNTSGGVASSNSTAGPVPPGPGGIINYQRDGGLSPTSNQLARWFSPELLAQASAGKLPSLNMGQALSLEEFERSIQHSSATVHN